MDPKTRASLLGRLLNPDDHASWLEFFSIYGPLIRKTALRAGLTQAEADDVVQETAIGVAERLGDLHYDPKKGSFRAWLLRMARWRVADLFRQRLIGLECDSDRSREDPPSTIEEIPDEAARSIFDLYDDKWKTAVWNVAVERVKQRVHPKKYQMFDLKAFKGWSTKEIADTFDVTRTTVWLAKCRVARALKQEVRLLEKEYREAAMRAPDVDL